MRSGHVGYFAELIDEWAPEAHADERLYPAGSSVVDAIAAGAPVEPLARYFEYWLLRLQGVYPSFACAACGGSLRGGRDDAAAGSCAAVPATARRRRHGAVGAGAAVPGGGGLAGARSPEADSG